MRLLLPTGRTLLGLLLACLLAFAVILLAPQYWFLGWLPAALFLAAFTFDAVSVLASRITLQPAHLPASIFLTGKPQPFRWRVTGPAGHGLSARLDVSGSIAFSRDGEVQQALVIEERFSEEGGEAGLVFDVVALRRGRGHMSRLWLRLYGPLGLAIRQQTFDVEHRMTVSPDLPHAMRRSLGFSLSDSYAGVTPRPCITAGGEFDALTEYQPGRDPRHIHWRQSARHGELLVKDYRDEQNHNVVLAFDTGYLMSEEPYGQSMITRLDMAIEAGLSIAATALRQGDAVGLFGFGPVVDAWAAPRTGGMEMLRLLASSASGLPYHMSATNFTLGLGQLEMRLQRRSLILLFTEFTDATSSELLLEGLARLSRSHLVLFVTLEDVALRELIWQVPADMRRLASSVVAGSLMRDRQLVFERLRQEGIEVIQTSPERFAGDLISRYLSIKHADRL
jgi:uncharacterized protein (DUF58 family)